MKIRIYKLKISELLIFILLIFTLFSEYLANNVSRVFLYCDDICAVLLLVYAIIKVILKRNEKLIIHEKIILFLYLVLLIIGVAGNLKSMYQNSWFAIAIDLLGWFKLFIVYISFLLIIKDNCETYYKLAIDVSKILVTVSLILAVLNLAKIINLTAGYDRFGVHSFSLGSHPSATSSIFAMITCLFLYDRDKNIKWITFSLILEILTFRFKAIAFTLAVVLASFFMKRKISLVKIGIIGIAVVLIAWNQIVFYFFSSTASRAVALNTSIQIANSLFPLGGGLATFGTNASGMYYSRAYVIYNLSNRWGFMKDNYAYIGDGGWASIIGQFGWIGTIIFICILYLLLKSILNRNRNAQHAEILPYISVLGYLLIASTNEAIFTSAYAIFFGLILVIMLKKDVKRKEVVK